MHEPKLPSAISYVLIKTNVGACIFDNDKRGILFLALFIYSLLKVKKLHTPAEYIQKKITDSAECPCRANALIIALPQSRRLYPNFENALYLVNGRPFVVAAAQPLEFGQRTSRRKGSATKPTFILPE